MKELIDKIRNEYNIDIDDNVSFDDLKLVVKDIWDNYYQNGIYLVCNLDYLDEQELIDKLSNEVFVQIISNDLLDNYTIINWGLILSFDFNKVKDLYLPIDFINGKYLKSDFKIIGVYSVNNNLGIVNSSYANAKALSLLLNVGLKSFVKKVINYQELIKDIITSYLLENNIYNLNKRDELVSKYGNDIKEMINNIDQNSFNDLEFLNMIYNFLNEKERIKD